MPFRISIYTLGMMCLCSAFAVPFFFSLYFLFIFYFVFNRKEKFHVFLLVVCWICFFFSCCCIFNKVRCDFLFSFLQMFLLLLALPIARLSSSFGYVSNSSLDRVGFFLNPSFSFCLRLSPSVSFWRLFYVLLVNKRASWTQTARIFPFRSIRTQHLQCWANGKSFCWIIHLEHLTRSA